MTNEIEDAEGLFKDMTIEELTEALTDMEKAIEELGSAFTYASIGTADLPEALSLALEETFPAWSRHNPVFLGTRGTHVQIRQLHWPERLLARLLAASMSERLSDRVSDFLYWRLMVVADRVFNYYDKRHYGPDEV